MIGVHAERVCDDPHAVRWVVPAGSLPVGRIRSAPGTLGELLCDGKLSHGLVEHGAVWLWVPDGQSWTGLGQRVQSALRDALTDSSGWVVDPAPGEVLHRVTTDVLDGSVGDFVRSHGGSVAAHRVGDTEVAVQLGGACEKCAAAEYTLRLRLVTELRRRCPNLVEVERDSGRLTLTLGQPPG